MSAAEEMSPTQPGKTGGRAQIRPIRTPTQTRTDHNKRNGHNRERLVSTFLANEAARSSSYGNVTPAVANPTDRKTP